MTSENRSLTLTSANKNNSHKYIPIIYRIPLHPSPKSKIATTRGCCRSLCVTQGYIVLKYNFRVDLIVPELFISSEVMHQPTGGLAEIETRRSREQLTRHGKSLFHHFFPKLVNILPMNDSTFMAELHKIGLLPGDLKDNIRAQDTRNKKSEYFLDNAIKPSVTSDVGTNFYDLLTVMEDSDFKEVKCLAKQIKGRLKETIDLDDDGQYGKCSLVLPDCFLHRAFIACSISGCLVT